MPKAHILKKSRANKVLSEIATIFLNHLIRCTLLLSNLL